MNYFHKVVNSQEELKEFLTKICMVETVRVVDVYSRGFNKDLDTWEWVVNYANTENLSQ